MPARLTLCLLLAVLLAPPPASAAIEVFGAFGDGATHFQGPSDVAVAPDGTMYVADRGNGRIQKIAPDGTFTARWADGAVTVATASDGTLWTSTGNHVDANGTQLGTLTGGGTAGPEAGIDVAPDGEIYTADHMSGRVERWNEDGQHIDGWALPEGPQSGGWPASVAASADAVYVYNRTRIHRFTRAGQHVTTFGGLGGGPGQFRDTASVAVGDAGELYAGESGNTSLYR